jgi:predicted phosphodiesterase
MRIAIVSDIHGNRTAFEAVLSDLRQTSPDLTVPSRAVATHRGREAKAARRRSDLFL